MRTPSVLVLLTALLLFGCAPDYDEPGAREGAGGYDLYGLLGETGAGAAEVLGEPVSVGERYEYSERGHTAFSATYDGGAKATYLVRPSGEGCLVRVDFEGTGARRPGTDPFDEARYGFPPEAVTAGRRETDYSWERAVRLPSGHRAVIQEGRAGRPGTGALWYAIRSESVYEACGL